MAICTVDSGERYVDREAEEDEYIEWMKSLPRYYATERQIFCHAELMKMQKIYGMGDG